jgi:hypothetical protein
MQGLWLAVFTKEEISSALHQMPPNKAPGPDGFSAAFFQHNWPAIQGEVSDAILHFLNNGQLEPRINCTNIALVPKLKNPANVSDFRPIGLCNVLYKMVSKVLANRLKEVLPSVISSNQSAFIPGRLITDNVLAAYETLHTMHTNMWSKVGFMGIKLDMSKTYDRVEWKFLEVVIEKLGFSQRWISLIMVCVRTVSYAVVVNG